jgi:hypothetical protein
MKTEIEKMSNKKLLSEYNHTRNVIDEIEQGGFGKWELIYLEELIREMDRREEGL